MSKYIDLKDTIHAETRDQVYLDEVGEVLDWLDAHPELTGRTITEGELIAAVDETNHEDMNEYQKARALLVHLGYTIPEPTNAEKLEALLEGGDINAQWGLRGGGVMFARELAHALDEAGVRASGGGE